MCEEIYTFKFDPKSLNSGGVDKTILKMPTDTLQQVAAKYMFMKLKAKPKIDQTSMDLINSIEYHK